MDLESYDNLVTALIDVQGYIGQFKRELSQKMNIPLSCIHDPFIETELVNGVARQYLYVGIDDKVPIGKLLNLDIEYFDEGFLVFEIGDILL